MIYCYDKRIIKNEDIIKEINDVRKKYPVVLYDEITDNFYNLKGKVCSIKGQRVFPRTGALQVEIIINAIESKGGIPINNIDMVNKVELWPLYIKTNRDVLVFEGRELLKEENIRYLKEIFGEKMFIKTVEKNFVGVINPNILERTNCNFCKALKLHENELFIVSTFVDIKEDKIGTKEYRCVVIDGKIYNISRLTFCQNHKIENKVLDFALNIVKNYPGTYVVDLMEDSNGLIDIVEFNPIEASGMYLYNSICDKSLDLKHDNVDLDKKIIDAEVIKPVLNSRCKWNNYGMFASDLRSICMIGERGALFFSDSFDDTNLYGYETESLKLSRQFEPINDL